MDDKIIEIVGQIIELYGWWGITLMGVAILLFISQLCYYVGNYSKIKKYRDNQRPEIRETTPKVSVIIPLFTEDYPFLDERLPLIMAQEGVDFEVVLIYIGNNTDFYDDLKRLQQVLPNIVVTKIQSNPRFPITSKAALNVGVKAARTEYLIFTTTECLPVSDRWLALMASGFKRGDLVIGYTAIEEAKGIGRLLMRTARMMDAANWLSRAVKGHTYRGINTNIGWTRELYFEARGFSHLSMSVGEDDLFIQKLLSMDNPPRVSVILSPRASLCEMCWGGWKWWREEYRNRRITFPLYPRSVRWFERWERYSRVLFMASIVAMVVLLPLEIKIAAAALFVLRSIAVSISVKRVAERLGERGMIWGYGIFDMLSPIYISIVDLCLKFRQEHKTWK